MKLFHIALVLLLVVLIDNVCGYTCEQESEFGFTTRKSCPGIFDSSEDIFCCGPKRDRKCCDSILGADDEDLRKIAENMPKVIGAIVAVILGLIVCCIVCCCCCPFCFLHKRRHRGIVHQPAVINTGTALPNPTQQSYAPVQSGPYPTQPATYPTQPAPYPTQPAGYVGQPSPYSTQPIGYSVAAPYPTQPPPPGFAPPQNANIQMQGLTGDQPPPYSEKQQAFNPNF